MRNFNVTSVGTVWARVWRLLGSSIDVLFECRGEIPAILKITMPGQMDHK
jgi:hypothetical protein